MINPWYHIDSKNWLYSRNQLARAYNDHKEIAYKNYEIDFTQRLAKHINKENNDHKITHIESSLSLLEEWDHVRILSKKNWSNKIMISLIDMEI